VHIKALGGAGVSAAVDAEIAEMQSRERMRREVVVLVRILGSAFRMFEVVVGFADGLVDGER
jgi:hypothetical protein